MTERKLLIPVSSNPPAKVKDPGVIKLVMEGAGAYNAKSGEFLFLPSGEEQRRRLAASLRLALFESAGLQQVDCGSDEAIFSLSERFARDWGENATAFSEERGRTLCMLGWSLDWDCAAAQAEAVMRTILTELRDGDFSFLEETQPTEGRAFVLTSQAGAGTLRARPGFLCPACGKRLLPDSPAGIRGTQPGADETPEPLEEVFTPGANTIQELCGQLGLEITRTIKAMLYVAEDEGGQSVPVAAFVRGDCSVSMNKLSNWAYKNRGLKGLKTADRAELEELIGEVAGYCGPVGMPEQAAVICDESVRGAKNTVVGANKPGYHLKGCAHGRDFDAPFADIAQITEGMPCSCGAAPLEACLLRDSGAISFGDGHEMTVLNSGDEKTHRQLSYRDRDGAHLYRIQWRGKISLESVIHALHANLKSKA